MTIYYVDCQLGTGCTYVTSLLNILSRQEKRESRSDKRWKGMGDERNRDGAATGIEAREDGERLVQKGTPCIIRHVTTLLRDATENSRITPAWLLDFLRASCATLATRRLHSEFNKRYVGLRYFSGYQIDR